MFGVCEESYRDHVAGAEGQKADHGELVVHIEYPGYSHS